MFGARLVAFHPVRKSIRINLTRNPGDQLTAASHLPKFSIDVCVYAVFLSLILLSIQFHLQKYGAAERTIDNFITLFGIKTAK